MVAELVDELGGLDALAPRPGPGRGRAVLEARLRPAASPQAHTARPLGRAARRQRPPSGRVPPVGADRGVGVGCALGHRAHAHGDPARSTRPSSSPRSTPCWPARRSWRRGTRASSWRRSSTRSSPAPRRELPLNRPNAGQCPDLPADAVVESMCVVDGDGIRGRDVAPRAGAVRGAAAPSRGRPGDDRRGRAARRPGAWPIRRSPSTRWRGAATCATPRPWSRSCWPARRDGCPSSPDTVHMTTVHMTRFTLTRFT